MTLSNSHKPTTVSYTRGDLVRRRSPRPVQRVVVSYAADAYRRYPGEVLRFFCRVEVREALSAFSLEVAVPAGLSLDETKQVTGPDDVDLSVRAVADSLYVVWERSRTTDAGAVFEFSLTTTIAHREQDWTLESGAVFTARSVAHGDRFSDGEWIDIPVSAKGAYLRYLPALYTRDDLMGRLLMLFESFWAPVSAQIGQIEKYFDPSTAPPDMLPWLASWLDLVLDERWPEAQRRDLLKSARRLYEKRGTRVGLQEYLRIYTGGDVQIVEHKAENLRLGRAAVMGDSRALGTANRPHTFTVTVRLPAHADSDVDWERVVTQIVDAEKPAHTSYTLRIEPNKAKD
ncbi:MAG: phage tail protein [Caldilineaceae bacterium]